jgi:hypothetical protein
MEHETEHMLSYVLAFFLVLFFSVSVVQAISVVSPGSSFSAKASSGEKYIVKVGDVLSLGKSGGNEDLAIILSLNDLSGNVLASEIIKSGTPKFVYDFDLKTKIYLVDVYKSGKSGFAEIIVWNR